jgi:hypothetical protein
VLKYPTADGMFFCISVTNNTVDSWRFSNSGVVPPVDTAALWFYRHFLARRLGWPSGGDWTSWDTAATRRDKIELYDCTTTETTNGYGWYGCQEWVVDSNGIVTMSLSDETGSMKVVSCLSREENAFLWRVARETVRTVPPQPMSATTGWPVGVSVGKGWPSTWEIESYDHTVLESPELDPFVRAIRTCVSNSLERLPPLDMDRTRALNSEREKRVR